MIRPWNQIDRSIATVACMLMWTYAEATMPAVNVIVSIITGFIRKCKALKEGTDPSLTLSYSLAYTTVAKVVSGTYAFGAGLGWSLNGYKNCKLWFYTSFNVGVFPLPTEVSAGAFGKSTSLYFLMTM